MTQPTPGPWMINQETQEVYAEPDPKGPSIVVADCCNANAPDSDKEQEANARLIAAAPMLYRACEMNVCLHKADDTECHADEGPCAARAAIRKASDGLARC